MTGDPPSAATFCANPAAWRAGRVTRMPSPDSGPAELSGDKPGGTAVEKIGGERTPERVSRSRVACRSALLAPHHVGAVVAREQPAQPELVVPEHRVRRERCMTRSGKRACKRAFRRG